MTSDPSGPSPARPIASCLDEPTIQQLLSLDDGGIGLLEELFGLFKEDTPGRMEGLEQAAAGGDAQAIAELAHALKGAAGTIGASRLRAIAQDLEKAGKSGRADGEAQRRVAELKDAYAEACAALDAFLGAG